MPNLPAMTIPLHPGARPPAVCPRCASAPKHAEAPVNRKAGWQQWTQVSEGMRQWYADRGFKALAQCGGCMCWIVETEEDG